jgi:hypothetical protein
MEGEPREPKLLHRVRQATRVLHDRLTHHADLLGEETQSSVPTGLAARQKIENAWLINTFQSGFEGFE